MPQQEEEMIEYFLSEMIDFVNPRLTTRETPLGFLCCFSWTSSSSSSLIWYSLWEDFVSRSLSCYRHSVWSLWLGSLPSESLLILLCFHVSCPSSCLMSENHPSCSRTLFLSVNFIEDVLWRLLWDCDFLSRETIISDGNSPSNRTSSEAFFSVTGILSHSLDWTENREGYRSKAMKTIIILYHQHDRRRDESSNSEDRLYDPVLEHFLN